MQEGEPAASRDGNIRIFEHEGVTIVHCNNRDNRGKPDISKWGLNTLHELLSNKEIMVTCGEKPFFKIGSRWREYASPRLLASYLFENVAFTVRAGDKSKPPERWLEENSNDREDFVTYLSRANYCNVVDPPDNLIRALLAPGYRPNVRAVDGFIKHPIVGQPYGDWLADHELIEDKEPPYEHLHNLFSGLGLAGPAHTALHTYLLACFHARSLDKPRALPLIESWQQKRGKSEVCSALRLIVDDEECIVPHFKSDEFRKTIEAILTTGRMVAIDNLDSAVDFNHSSVATGVTSKPGMRFLYDKGASGRPGTLYLLNLITGAASISPDLLSRALRIELTGKSTKITPNPLDYARDHRKEIIGECLHALRHSEPLRVDSRSSAFDGAGLGAYCMVFGVRSGSGRESLERSRRSAGVLAQPVLEHFAHHHSFKVKPRIFHKKWHPNKVEAQQIELPEDIEGESLLGITLENGEWTDS